MASGISRHRVISLASVASIAPVTPGAAMFIEVANFSALPAPGTLPAQTYIVLADEGSKWKQSLYGGNYYPKGYYYDAGTEYIFSPTPFQATQADVDAGLINDQFVSPLTLNEWYTAGPGRQLVLFTWKYSTNTTAADPGNGNFRMDNVTASLVTKLYVDDLTSGTQIDISNLFEKVKGNWLIHIQQRNDATKWMQFTSSDLYIDNTGWWTLDVVFAQQGSGGALPNLTDCLFTFVNENEARRFRVLAKVANYVITRNDQVINCTANSFAVTLPLAGPSDGEVYTIKNSGEGIITLNTTGGETVDGSTSHLLGPGVSIDVESDGTNYIII